MKQNLFWQTQLLHNVSSALAMGTQHASARTKLCVVPVEASMKGEPAKFLNSFSSQNTATAEELTQPGPVSVQYARKQPRRQEKHGTHAQENMRSQQLLLCYDPWDGSHSFIGNQAVGQAREHHGSQVTNQQEVT